MNRNATENKEKTAKVLVKNKMYHVPDMVYNSEYRPFKYSLSFSFNSADLFLLLSHTTC